MAVLPKETSVGRGLFQAAGSPPVRTSDILASLFDATASATLCLFLASRGAAELAPANAIAISPPAMTILAPALALSQRSNVTRSSADRVRGWRSKLSRNVVAELARNGSFGSRPIRVCQGLRHRERMVGAFRHSFEIRVHRPSEHGEGNWPTLKQSSAQLLLQRSDCVGQRGLGHPAASGCARETVLVAQRQEIADLGQLHVSTPAQEPINPRMSVTTSATRVV